MGLNEHCMKLENLKDQLGKDLLRLVQEVNLPLVEVISLSPLKLPNLKRASFRLRFADGRILKGRRFGSIDQAKRVQNLWKYLNPRHFPKVISCSRSAMLIEWIEGKPLTSVRNTPEVLRRCGDLHGLVHAINISEEMIRLSSREAKFESLKTTQAFSKQVCELVMLGALEKAQCKFLMELVESNTPKHFSYGLVCGDFCEENLLMTSSGNIHVIDNEKLAINAYDYDLARTWYRWPMNPVQRMAYYDGYTRHRSHESFSAHFLYWVIKVLIRSAIFRLQATTQASSVPIQRLKSLLKNVQNGITTEPELYL
jgi:thiamine kinase-like enzyme